MLSSHTIISVAVFNISVDSENGSPQYLVMRLTQIMAPIGEVGGQGWGVGG